MDNVIKRGDIWVVDWSPGRGSEQTGMRPALVIQTGAANRNPHYLNTIVLTVSSKGKEVPFHIPIHPSAENGLEMPSFVKCEQVLTISKERLVRRLGYIEKEQFDAVAIAIRRVLEL